MDRPPEAAGPSLFRQVPHGTAHENLPARAPLALALARKNEGVGRPPEAAGPRLRWNSSVHCPSVRPVLGRPTPTLEQPCSASAARRLGVTIPIPESRFP